jgi:hypothetical protein
MHQKQPPPKMAVSSWADTAGAAKKSTPKAIKKGIINR